MCCGKKKEPSVRAVEPPPAERTTSGESGEKDQEEKSEEEETQEKEKVEETAIDKKIKDNQLDMTQEKSEKTQEIRLSMMTSAMTAKLPTGVGVGDKSDQFSVALMSVKKERQGLYNTSTNSFPTSAAAATTMRLQVTKEIQELPAKTLRQDLLKTRNVDAKTLGNKTRSKIAWYLISSCLC